MTQGDLFAVHEVKTNTVHEMHEKDNRDSSLVGKKTNISGAEKDNDSRQHVHAEQINHCNQHTLEQNVENGRVHPDQTQHLEQYGERQQEWHRHTADGLQNDQEIRQTSQRENGQEESSRRGHMEERLNVHVNDKHVHVQITKVQKQQNKNDHHSNVQQNECEETKHKQTDEIQEQNNDQRLHHSELEQKDCNTKQSYEVSTLKTETTENIFHQREHKHNEQENINPGEKENAATTKTCEKENAVTTRTDEKENVLTEETDGKENAATRETVEKENAVTGETNQKEDDVTLATDEKENAVVAKTGEKENVVKAETDGKENAVTTETVGKENAITGVTDEKEETVAAETNEIENAVTADEKENAVMAETNEKENVVSAESDTANTGGQVTLKTLADLICLCRSKGLQIYNNKTNRPESDRLLYSDADLNRTDDRGSRMSRRHCSDDRASSERAKCSLKSFPRNSDVNSASTSGYYGRRDRLNTGTSLRTSTSLRSSRIESRSSMRSGIERRLVEEDVDADEVLQQRMWKRSRRRREQKLSLLEVAKQKQEEIEAASIINHLQKTVSRSNMADTNARVSFKAGEMLNRDGNFDEHFGESEIEIRENDIEKQFGEGDELGDTSKLSLNGNAEIEEFRIRDGETTLMLYKLNTDEIKIPTMHNEVMKEHMLSDNTDEIETGEGSLKNNAFRHGSRASNQSKPISQGDTDKHTNNKTPTSLGEDCSSENSDSEAERGRNGQCQEESVLIKPGDDKAVVMTEYSMDSQRRSNFSQKDAQPQSTDSGIGSESDKDSVKQRNIDSVDEDYHVTNTKKLENDSVTKSVKEIIEKDTHKMKTTNETSPENDNHDNLNKPSGSKTGHKKGGKTKRSIGNGFLVSSDGEGDDDTGRATVESGKNSLGAQSTKTRPLSINEMPHETRMILLMAKIRERYDEEKQTQSTYIQQISETRRDLRDEYKHIQSKIETKPIQTVPEVPESEAAVKPKPQSKPQLKPKPKPEPVSKEEEESPRRWKKKAVSRIDCKWSPNHPLYDQIKSGFKSTITIPNTRNVQRELRNMKPNRHRRWSTSSADDVILNHDKVSHSKRLSNGKTVARDTNTIEKREVNFSDEDHIAGDLHSRLQRRRREHQEGNRPRSKSLHERISMSRYQELERQKETEVNGIPTRAKLFNRNSPQAHHEKINIDEERMEKERNHVKSYQQTTDNTNKIPKYSRFSYSNQPTGNLDFKSAKHHPDKNSHRKQESLLNGRAGNHVIGNGGGSHGGVFSLSRSVSTKTVRSVSTQTPSGKVPISLAVDIVQSRNKYYAENGSEQVIPREHRIAKLFKDLQQMRQRPEEGDGPGSNSESSISAGKDSSFLFMDYSTSNTPLCEHQSDRDLNNFLYRGFNYELCSKGRPLYVSPDRKERALVVLKNKVNSKLQHGTRVG